MANSDCKSCHFENKKAVGPSYVSIANRYKKQSGSIDKLAEKIINGGGGSWGTQYVMSAHPQLSKNEARQIVEYIYSLTDEKKKEIPVPASGVINLSFNDNEPSGQYTIVARYTDKGGNKVGPLSATDIIRIRNAVVRPIDADGHPGFGRFRDVLTSGGHKAHIELHDVDLQSISQFSFKYSAKNSDGVFEVRMDSKAGPVIASVPFGPTGSGDKVVTATMLKSISGKHNLYFFITRKQKPYNESANIKEIRIGM